MKIAPAALITFLNTANVGFRADLYTLTLLDGTIFRWTTCDKDIAVGGNTYLADRTVLGRGNLRTTSRLEIDTLEVQLAGAAQVQGKPACAQAALGLFDEARLQLDVLAGPDLPTAISYGAVKAWFEGRVAGIEPSPDVTRVQVQSELVALNMRLPRFLFGLSCMNAVYDPNCTLVKATFTLAGTVSNNAPTTTTVPSTTAGIIAKANSYYNLGVLRFTSGALNGTRRGISGFVVSGGVATFTLAIPLPSVPGVGDAISVFPGCDRTFLGGCTKFSNTINFRGFPHIPAPEGGF